MSSDDDTLKVNMGESDGVPIEIVDDEATRPRQSVTQPVQADQILEVYDQIEVIDQSDGVPLLLPGMADTEPSNPHQDTRPMRPSHKALLPNN